MPTTETRRLNPVLMWTIFIGIIAIAVIAARYFTREKLDVKVAAVARRSLYGSTTATGKVEPIEEFPAYAPAPGVVSKIYVDLLQKVKPGQLLIRMDDSDAAAHLASANATLQTAQANLHDIDQGGTQDERIGLANDLNRAQLQRQQAANDLAALQQLQQKGAASPSEVAAAQQRLATTDGALKSAQQRSSARYSASDRSRALAQVADAKAAIAAAESSYANVNIRSKIAGTVYSIPVSLYDYVGAGSSLIDVADLNHVQVRAYFDEPEIGRLAVGQPARITWEAKEGKEWHGHISVVPTTIITYGTRYVGECIITVDDAKGDLLPNTNVQVIATTSQRLNALSIPREALHTDSGDYVYRVVNNKLLRTPVQLGLYNRDWAEILSGLNEKDVIAIHSNTVGRELANGLPVNSIE